MKTERTATYSSLLSFPYLVLRTKAKRKREGVVHEIRQFLGGGGTVCSNGFYADIPNHYQMQQYESCLKSFLQTFGSFEVP